MTEEKVLAQIEKMQNRVLGWIMVGMMIGFTLGWVAAWFMVEAIKR